MPQGVGVRVPPWAPDVKREFAIASSLFLRPRAKHLRALREGLESCGLQAAAGSRHVTESQSAPIKKGSTALFSISFQRPHPGVIAQLELEVFPQRRMHRIDTSLPRLPCSLGRINHLSCLCLCQTGSQSHSLNFTWIWTYQLRITLFLNFKMRFF